MTAPPTPPRVPKNGYPYGNLRTQVLSVHRTRRTARARERLATLELKALGPGRLTMPEWANGARVREVKGRGNDPVKQYIVEATGWTGH